MATGKISVTEGSGKDLATNTITEDAITKNIQRVVQNSSAGVEVIPLTDAALRATAVPVTMSGVSTEAKQDAANTSISNVDTNIGAKADAAASSDTGTFSLISLFKRLLQRIASLLSVQTDGSQKSQIVDGSGNVIGSTSNRLHTRAVAPQIADANNSGTLVGVTTSRTVAVVTTTGNNTLTSVALFLSTDVGSAVSGTGIPANSIITAFANTSSVTYQSAPNYPSNPNPTSTATGASTATIRVGYKGTFTQTGSLGIVRQLAVIGANVYSGLGGVFVFQYGSDGTTAVISEVRVITDFSVVRDFDLINAGEYFRIMFCPSRVLTSGEVIFYNTTQRTQNDGSFVRLADQQIEKQNAAMGQTFSYQKGFDISGVSADVPLDDRAFTTTTNLAGSAVFTSYLFNMKGYNQAQTEILSDTNGTITISSYSDAAGTDLIRTLTVPYLSTQGYVYIAAPQFGNFQKWSFTNGSASAQTDFYFSTKFTTKAISGQITNLTSSLSTGMTANLGRNILVGIDATGTTFTNVQVNSLGQLVTASSLIGGTQATYSATVVGLAPALLATDIFTITGSATKTIKITQLVLTAVKSSGGSITADILLIKRSTANTAGTSTARTAVPHDSSNVAATATVLSYATLNPVVGTSVGTMGARSILVPNTGTSGDTVVLSYGDRPGQQVTLRGIAQVFAVNLNGITLANTTFNIKIEWSEE